MSMQFNIIYIFMEASFGNELQLCLAYKLWNAHQILHINYRIAIFLSVVSLQNLISPSFEFTLQGYLFSLQNTISYS